VSRRNHVAIADGLKIGAKIGQNQDLAVRLRRMFTVDVVPPSAQMALGLLVLSLCVTAATPIKSTVFGYEAAWLACAAVVALSIVALSFLANAMRMKQRVLHLAFVVSTAAKLRRAAGEADKSAATQEEALGLWPHSDALRVRFAPTPAAAQVTDAGSAGMALLREIRLPRLKQALSKLNPDTAAAGPIGADTRVALYLIFASEVSQIRWATFSSAICSLTVAACAYFYPVTGADVFVLFNLVLLAGTGLFAGHSATMLERDEVLSNILCNRTAKLAATSSLFRYIAFPFVMLAVMLAIINVPGVMSWGDGIFKKLLDLVGGSGFLG
jgi:hypothetical protein